ncbi:MAG: serine acetyltransferase [Bacteroidetes bacterium]|nr:serine acetyltransferase [Bacteroidota bacterium]
MTNPIFQNNMEAHRLSFDSNRLGHWADEMFQWLFCIHPKYAQEEIFLVKEQELKRSLAEFIVQSQPAAKNPDNIVEYFFNRLPDIYKLLTSDLETMYNSDPAAKSIHEVLLAYPGFYAIATYRIAHELWLFQVPVIPRLLTEHAHFKTGIDIHPGAAIGERFLIDHGTGVVIGETCNIGNDVKIYQGVTLGALSVNRDHAAIKRHPTIGDRVVIYANATILGGYTVIGNDSVIGGNVWITQSIPSNSLVFHKSEIIIKNNSNFPEPLNFII